MATNLTRYWLTALHEGNVPLPPEVAPVLVGVTVGGASDEVVIIRVRPGVTAPEGYTDLSASDLATYQFTAPWIAHQSTPAWTGSEKGVLVPEADGTAALVQAAAATWGDIEGGWDVCERLALAADTTIGGNLYPAGVYRLVRYTGTKPAELAAYPYLTAAGVAGAVALKEV